MSNLNLCSFRCTSWPNCPCMQVKPVIEPTYQYYTYPYYPYYVPTPTDQHIGWICPKCDTVHNPRTMTCDCTVNHAGITDVTGNTNAISSISNGNSND